MDEMLIDAREISLCLKNVNKTFGRGKSKQQALADFNMTVPKGIM